MNPSGKRLTIVGAGLAGGLLATLLARQGWSIDLFEKRPDPRLSIPERGRSINLALAERGLHALRAAGLDGDVIRDAVAMRGRLVHPPGGVPQLLPYGRSEAELIWSVSRASLNLTLLNAAEAAGARVHFDRTLSEVDWDAGTATFTDAERGSLSLHPFDALIGSDGAGSAVRAAMAAAEEIGEKLAPLDHGYRELSIPPHPDGSFRLETGALHIWPRGAYMCIALPNRDGSFTATLFLPNEGDTSLDSLADPAAAREFFGQEFPDLLPHLHDFEVQWRENPRGSLGTLTVRRWHLGGRGVILGDAAHAMVPFHGQGMNCAFEDCIGLMEQLSGAQDFESAFATFTAERQENAAAIQVMAVENYVEMRDQVADAGFLLQRELESVLAERHPDRFIPRYSMVSFTRIPYATAFARGVVQREILLEASRGKSSLAEIDLPQADALVLERLSVLDEIPPPPRTITPS